VCTCEGWCCIIVITGTCDKTLLVRSLDLSRHMSYDYSTFMLTMTCRNFYFLGLYVLSLVFILLDIHFLGIRSLALAPFSICTIL
jgi:hypothetical protein